MIDIKITIPDYVLREGSQAAQDYMNMCFGAFQRYSAKAGLADSATCGVAPEVAQPAAPVKQELREINDPVVQPEAPQPAAAPAAQEAPVAAEKPKATRKPRAAKEAAPAPAPAPEAAPVPEDVQDAVDEMIDAAVHGTPVVATRADLNDAVQAYIKVHGMAEVQRIGEVVGQYPISHDHDAVQIANAIRALNYACEHDAPGKPCALPDFKAAAPTPAPKPASTGGGLFDDAPSKPAAKVYAPSATGDQVKDAMRRYIAVYGQDVAGEDLPKLLTGAIGTTIERFGDIPQTPLSYGSAFAALDRACDENPFKRALINGLEA